MYNVIMKIVLDVEEKMPKENDILIYSRGKWVIVSRESFLKKYIQRQRELDKKIDDLKEMVIELAKVVKEK